MRTLDRCAFSISAAAALLGGCGGTQPQIGAPGAMPLLSTIPSPHRLLPTTSSYQYQVLYRFQPARGAHPYAALVEVNGALYGTTAAGGSHGLGTVYSVTQSGAQKELYSFKGGSDGARPLAALIDVNGTLYGTTSQGGSHSRCLEDYVGCGTVFSISTDGAEKVLYRFQGGTDGSLPLASLTNVSGTLYGTTASGGYYNNGTVYSLTRNGSEKVLHRFAGGSGPDGSSPLAGLTYLKGLLYGTTYYGGGGCRNQNLAGCGTVYSISPNGVENVLHSFADVPDGAYARSDLVAVKGTLYGTTIQGGELFGNHGAVFSITTAGSENVVYRFGADGESSQGKLVNVNGALYGTTPWGSHGRGEIYSVTLSGVEQVLYTFEPGPDGARPTED